MIILPPLPIFLIISIFFLVLSVFYILFAAAIIYHLFAFRVPGQTAPLMMTIFFLAASAVLWLAAITFLLRIPELT